MQLLHLQRAPTPVKHIINGKYRQQEQLVLTFKVFRQMCSEIHCLRGVVEVQKVRVL